MSTTRLPTFYSLPSELEHGQAGLEAAVSAATFRRVVMKPKKVRGLRMTGVPGSWLSAVLTVFFGAGPLC